MSPEHWTTPAARWHPETMSGSILKAPVRHFKKLFGGRETAFEVHRKAAWFCIDGNGNHVPAFCYRCRSKDVRIQLEFHMNPEELLRREPMMAAMIMEEQEDHGLPVWKSKYGPMTPFWKEYACGACQKIVEIQAARLPSHILVQIDRGPDPDKTIVPVSG